MRWCALAVGRLLALGEEHCRKMGVLGQNEPTDKKGDIW